MKEIILCKYGEVVLKGLNKASFEHMMAGELKKRLQTVGPFSVYYRQSTLYAEPLSSDCDVNEAFEIAKKLFGISTVSRALAVEKDLNSILEGAKEYLPPLLEGHSSFKVEGKRADKTFPMTSPELSGEVGAAILEVMPDIKVRMDNPEVIVHVEIREEYAFLHAGSERGAGGMPPRSNGRALLLLSGGIDSPVAGYMMAKRGAGIVALYFESIPYTSELAREKVMTLAEELAQYTGKMTVNVAGITRLQEVIRDNTNEEYFTVLLRRSMMRIATRCAKEQHCLALITGESLGQVASQTMNALAATDSVTDLPVFRPCIGMDKEEIVKLARQIGTFDTSILPYEDCCTVFTPRHPKTRPTIEKVLEEERKIPDLEKLEDEAFNSIYTKNIIVYEW